MSQWADAHRRLSSEASFEPGKWRTSRAAYQRGIMDACSDPAIQDVVVMSSAQVGKTEILLNCIGYFAHYDPAPIMLVEPSIDMGEDYSKNRITPMIRDSPALTEVFADTKSRDSGNTITLKRFPGGYLVVVGANSPRGLRGRPIRVLLFDELDSAPPSAGTEGDPLTLAEKRTNNFPNRKRVKVSTPTVKGFSRIEAAFLESDQRRFFVPCPHCGHCHPLYWGNVIFTNGPDSAVLKCPVCGGTFNDAQKNDAVRHAEERQGGWRATAPFNGVAGFHLNELYSPWRTLAEIVDDFLKAKEYPERLKVWVNTSLGETWDESGTVVDENALMERRENYEAPVPGRVLCMTWGCDVQPDRLEASLVGWGAGDESWQIEHVQFYGDPDIPEGGQGSPWDNFSAWRTKPRRHATQGEMTPWGGCIDSGGHNTQAVYEYGRRYKHARVFVIKGKGGTDQPIVTAPRQKRSGKVRKATPVFIVGVDQVKDQVQRALKVSEPGKPGYCHFPNDAAHGLEYFRQLTAEKKLVEKDSRGYPRRVWKLIAGRRNEALDCRVYAVAARTLMQPDYAKIAFRLKKAAETEADDETPQVPEPAPPDERIRSAVDDVAPRPENPARKLRRTRRSGFVNQW